MLPDLNTTAAAIALAGAGTAVKEVIKTFVTPKLNEVFKQQAANRDLIEHAFVNKLEAYLVRTYEKHFYLSTIVFGGNARKLDDLYVPLTLVREGSPPASFLIDEYPKQLIATQKRILITDSAGMGKSTLSKYLFLECIRTNASIPIFIELRRLRSDRTILDAMYEDLRELDKDMNEEFILKLITRGDFIFFLDGYDEIASDDRDTIVAGIQSFINKAPKNYFVLTSRPDDSLTAFANFRRFTIRALTQEEAFTLIRKYDENGALSEELIKKLADPALQPIHEFLTNPLLTSLLYKAYEYKATIPYKKHTFYRQVYDALFERHDLTKDGGFVRKKMCELDTEDFHRLLRALGYRTMKMGQIEYDKDQLLELIRTARVMCPDLQVRESAVLDDLLATVPLFLCEGNSYRWAHKSLQDYFAANFLWVDAGPNQAAILEAMGKSPRNRSYVNMLDLYYDMDRTGFRHHITYPLIKDFLRYYESSYTKIDRAIISQIDIHKRKLVTFCYAALIVPYRLYKRPVMGDPNPLPALNPIYTKLAFPPKGALLSSISVPDGRGVSVSMARFPRAVLVELLATKGDPIIGLFGGNAFTATLASSMRARRNYRLRSPTIVDDNPNSALNTRAKFAETTALVQARAHVFDLDRCIEAKRTIEAEITARASGADLLTNL